MKNEICKLKASEKTEACKLKGLERYHEKEKGVTLGESKLKSRKIKVKGSAEVINMMKKGVCITVSDERIGSKGKSKSRLRFCTETTGSYKALVFTDNMDRQQLLSLDNFFSGGIKIHFNAWKSRLYTLENDWRNQREVWVNILGLLHYLWSIDNARTIATEVGAGLEEEKGECLEFGNMESLGKKVWGDALKSG